jgi:CelD/BcsL family acetyltransferase involved in cellulose biosynthesis
MTSATQWIEDPAEFAALAEEWDAILGPDARPFDLHCWQASWWKAFGGSDRLAVATVRREGSLVGVFPLRRRGRLLHGLVNGHSTSCRPLAVDEEAMEDLVDMVASGAGGGLELRGLPIGDPGVVALERRIAADRMRTIRETAFAGPFVEIRGDWEEWRKANKKRWKAPLEQKRRKMEREYEAEIRPMDEVHDLDHELVEGLRLEAGGWKGDEGTAINSSAETISFYRDISREFARRGELRFSWIRLDGVAVAFDFCILFGNRLWTLKSAYDEEYRKLAPGLVRQLAEIERCFETGVEVLELLGEEAGWKTRFASGNHQHVNLYAFRGGPSGLARYAWRKRLRPALRTAYRRAKAARSR